METQRGSTNKANRKKVWFDFHIRCGDENNLLGKTKGLCKNLKYLKNK